MSAISLKVDSLRCGSFCPRFGNQHPYYKLLSEPTNRRRVFQTDSESHQLHPEFDFCQPIKTQRRGLCAPVEGRVRVFHYVGFSPRKISVWEFQFYISEAVGSSFTGDLILKVSLSASRLNKVGDYGCFSSYRECLCVFPSDDPAWICLKSEERVITSR